jgi:hypothetical protein
MCQNLQNSHVLSTMANGLKEKIYNSAAIDYDSSFEEEDEIILMDEATEVGPVTYVWKLKA